MDKSCEAPNWFTFSADYWKLWQKARHEQRNLFIWGYQEGNCNPNTRTYTIIWALIKAIVEIFYLNLGGVYARAISGIDQITKHSTKIFHAIQYQKTLVNILFKSWLFSSLPFSVNRESKISVQKWMWSLKSTVDDANGISHKWENNPKYIIAFFESFTHHFANETEKWIFKVKWLHYRN